MQRLNQTRRKIAELVLEGIALSDIMQSITATNWNDWIAEVEETRHTSIQVCCHCAHNIPVNETTPSGLGYVCVPCLKAWQEERANGIECCSKCGQTYRRKDMRLYGSLGLPHTHYNYTFLCSDCATLVIEEHKTECPACGNRFLSFNFRRLCDICHTPKLIREAERLELHKRRAQDLGLPSTLTLREWLETLNRFKWKCGYCSAKYDGLEHYTPLSLGGGTTVNNCIPSCKACNMRKKDKHPNKFTQLFPSANIERIRAYFEELEKVA